MKKTSFQNREGAKIVVEVDKVEDQKGIVFVMHGLGGFKEQPHIRTIGKAFKEHGYTVVFFDTAHTYGESEGNYEQATITNYLADLEDVIKWARGQEWFQEPFALSGHSLGGISVVLYAQKYPERVSVLAPISPVVSGELSKQAAIDKDAEAFVNWEKTGWKEAASESIPGLIKRLPWSHMVNRLTYDTLPDVEKLVMPKLFVVGELDMDTRPDIVQKLMDVCPEPKHMDIIPGAPHTFRTEEHLATLKQFISEWLKSV